MFSRKIPARDGFKVFANGKQIVEIKDGPGRRAGVLLRGGWITNEFTDDFAKGPATIAALTFHRRPPLPLRRQVCPQPEGCR